MAASEEEFSGSDVEESGDEEIHETKEAKRAPYNNQELMKIRLEQLKSDIDWIERMDIAVDTSDLPGVESGEKETEKNQVEDDFERELLFYRQAQVAAKEALSRLCDMKIPTERPEDYFAEMVKSDAHMQKIRQKMLSKKESIEKSEKAKKQRTLKKYGKKIQHEVLQKRQQEKKKILQAVDHLKKNKGKLDKLSGKNDDEIFDVGTDHQKKQMIGQKRKRKDEKFGFGGRKQKMKKNSAESSADAMSSFKRNVHGKKPGFGKPGRGGGVTKGNANRPGKSRRAKMKRK